MTAIIMPRKMLSTYYKRARYCCGVYWSLEPWTFTASSKTTVTY